MEARTSQGQEDAAYPVNALKIIPVRVWTSHMEAG